MRFLELFLLNGFAVAQPVFAVLSGHPEFFAAHDAKTGEIVLLVVVMTCLLPVLITAAHLVVSRASPNAADRLHNAFLGLLVSLAVVQPMASVAHDDVLAFGAVLVALLVGAGAAWAHRRQPRLRSSLRLVSPMALIFPALFFGSEAVRPALQAGEPAAFRAPRIESDTPVVLLFLDELPLSSLQDERGAIDAERHPNFAALARDAHWFRNGTSVAPTTQLSLLSILTGNRRTRSDPAYASDYPENLFTLLANGRGVLAYEGPTHLCPREVCGMDSAPPTRGAGMISLLSDVRILYAYRVLPAAWAVALPDVTTRLAGFAEPQLPTEGPAASHAIAPGNAPPLLQEQWRALDKRPRARLPKLASALRALRSGRRPTLLFLHLALPHVPWEYFPSGQAYFPAALAHGPADWSGPEWESIQALQRHLLQVGYADRVLGLLVSALKDAGLYDPALIVVTADHGFTFQPGNHSRRITPASVADILSIPLLIKRPAQQHGVVSDRNVETIDIVPTIAAELGISVPWQVEGHSVFDNTVPERPLKVAIRRSHPDVRFDTATLEAARKKSVARIQSIFEPGSDGLLRVGLVGRARATRALLGRRVDDLRVRQPEASPAVAVQLPTLAWLADVSRERDAIPAHIIGRVQAKAEAAEPTSRDLAIAINGSVEAVTQTYSGDRSWLQFSAMLREGALREGANRVEVFELAYEGDRIALVPTVLEPYDGPAARGVH